MARIRRNPGVLVVLTLVFLVGGLVAINLTTQASAGNEQTIADHALVERVTQLEGKVALLQTRVSSLEGVLANLRDTLAARVDSFVKKLDRQRGFLLDKVAAARAAKTVVVAGDSSDKDDVLGNRFGWWDHWDKSDHDWDDYDWDDDHDWDDDDSGHDDDSEHGDDD